VSNVKVRNFILALLLVGCAFLIFPPLAASSSIFYISGSFFLIALLLSSLGKGFARGLHYLGLIPNEKQSLPALLAWGVAAFAVSLLATGAVSLLLYHLGYLDSDVVAQKVQSLPLQSMIIAFTLAPLGEESLFRGYLFRKISEKSGSALAGAIVSSAIFAALHVFYGSVAEVAVAFFVALALCAFRQKTGSLIPPLVAHASFNFLSILLSVLG
jgi:membrane protease YdiL (CAAX protease family)